MHTADDGSDPVSTTRVRMLVIGRRRLFVDAILRLVQSLPGWAAVSADPAGAREALARFPADIVLLETDLDRFAAITVGEALAELRPSARLVLLVRADDGEWSSLADESGAAAVLTCQMRMNELVDRLLHLLDRSGVTLVLRGATTPTAMLRGEALLLAQLTPRQGNVLRLLAVGRSADDIATSLSISPNTVRTHLQNIMVKLNVSCRLEAVALARRAGFLERSPVARTP